MLNHLLDKRRNVFLLAAFAVFMESLTSPCLKIGSQNYETFSIGYFFWFYLRRGFSYILLFVWSTLIFHEMITLKQIIGIAVISLGMVISVSDEHGKKADPNESSPAQ